MKNELPEVGTKTFAKYVAMVIRNAMEDFHHKHLTDEQMKELNPIIRNAIYTALYAYVNRKQSEQCTQFIGFNRFLIPKYWEDPELLNSLTDLLEKV